MPRNPEPDEERDWNEPVNLPNDDAVLRALLAVDPDSDPVDDE